MNSRIYSINEIKSIIRPILSLYDVERVYLFGSYAKDTATSTSDIDFFIEKYKYRKFYSLASLYSDLEDALDKNIDIITDTSIETNKQKNDVINLYQNILNERVCIYEIENHSIDDNLLSQAFDTLYDKYDFLEQNHGRGR